MMESMEFLLAVVSLVTVVTFYVWTIYYLSSPSCLSMDQKYLLSFKISSSETGDYFVGSGALEPRRKRGGDF